MTEKHLSIDVFTPTKPARLTFVERESIDSKLINALTTPGKQVVVYGHSGSGKTTLLVNKLHSLYENHITSRCITGLTFEQIILDAFDQLAPFYKEERIHKTVRAVSSGLSSTYIGIMSQISSQRSTENGFKERRLLPPQLTPQTLAKLLGEAHCCWVNE